MSAASLVLIHTADFPNNAAGSPMSGCSTNSGTFVSSEKDLKHEFEKYTDDSPMEATPAKGFESPSSQDGPGMDCERDLESGLNPDASTKKPRSSWWLWGSRTCEVNDTYTRSLDDCAPGYAELAVFQSSDSNFALYRGFGYLHGRVLSSLQYEIGQLEHQLDDLDQWDRTHGDDGRLVSQNRDEVQSVRDKETGEWPPQFELTRPEILAKLRVKLLEYDEMLLKSRDVGALQKPSKRDYRSVRDWLDEHKPLVTKESEFIRRKEDLISLRVGREYAGFDAVVEHCLSKLDTFLIRHLGSRIVRKIFLTPELRAKSSDGDLHYYAPARVEVLVNIIITAIIFILLVLPVVVMYELSDREESPFQAIAILIIFTLLFGCAMSGLTKARRQELFAASAAYCAVLVVFISNFSPQTVNVASCPGALCQP